MTLKLEKGTSVGGTIQDESGEPVADATVTIVAPRKNFMGLSQIEKLRSDREGKWRCNVAPKENAGLIVRVKHPDFLEGRAMASKEMRQFQHVMHIKRGKVVKGQVLDKEGKPVENAKVAFMSLDATHAETPTAKTDSQGHFTLKQIPYNSKDCIVYGKLQDPPTIQTLPVDPAIRVLVWAKGFAPQHQELNVVKENKPMEFRLESGATIRGRVVDPEGNPIPLTRVYASWQKIHLLDSAPINCDKHGRFVWNSAPHDKVVLNFRASPGWAGEERVFLPSKKERTITLFPMLAVRGTVSDEATGRPIDRFRFAWDDKSEIGETSFTRSVEGKNGRYEARLNSFMSSTIYLHVKAEGYEHTVSRKFNRKEGKQTYDFKLKKIKKTSEKKVSEEDKQVDLVVVIARHQMLLDGKEIITWAELEEKIAALPDPTLAHPHLYITKGARQAGVDKVAKEEIWRLHRQFKLKGRSQGSLWPRSDFRYDQIKTEKDLLPDQQLRTEGQVVDGKGKPVTGVEILRIMPVDESIPYKTYDVTLVRGRVRNPLEHIMTHSDDKGRFALYPPKDEKFYIVALHPTAGFSLKRGNQWFDDTKVQLIPWAMLESPLDGEPGQDGSNLRTRVRAVDGFPEISFTQYSSDLKNDSSTEVPRFVQIPPIFPTTISRSFSTKEGSSSSIPEVTISFLSGESRRLNLGPMSEKQKEQLNELRKDRGTRVIGKQPRSTVKEKARPTSKASGVLPSKKATATEPVSVMLTAFGKVLDPTGKPVAGATVYLREWSTYRISSEPHNQNLNDILATTQTDAEGAFRFEAVRSNPFFSQWRKEIPWDVVVVAKPYAIVWQHLHVAKSSEPMTITLAPEAKVTGQVNDKQGQPVKDAKVEVYAIKPLVGPLYPSHGDPETLDLQLSRLAPSARTDAKGKVTIAGLPSDRMLRVTVTSDDHQRSLLRVVTTDKPQADIEIIGRGRDRKKKTWEKVYSSTFSTTLKPALPRIVGQVLTADSKQPLPGLKVMNIGSLGTTTDQEGRFTIKDIRKSPCRLYVGAPGDGDYLSQLVVIDMVKEKKEMPVTIELARGEIISGKVIDSDSGEGIAGISVLFDNRLDINKATVDTPFPNSTKTDSNGHFRLAVPPGKGKVRVYGPVSDYSFPTRSYPPKDIEGFFREVEVVADKPTAEVKFSVHRGGPPVVSDPNSKTIKGIVTGPDGKPAAGAEVGLDRWLQDANRNNQLVQTDPNGHFSFQVTSRWYFGENIIVAIDKKRKLRGHASMPSVAKSKMPITPIKIRLVPTGVVTGYVLEGNKPLAGVQIQLDECVPNKEDSEGSLTTTNRDFAKTDQNGRFQFPFVEADREFDLFVYSERHMNGSIQGKVAAGKTLEVKPFNLLKLNKSVAGKVVDADGKPMEGVTVSVKMRSGKMIPRAFGVRTGKDGRFSIRGVPDVPLTVKAYLARRPKDPKDRKRHYLIDPVRIDADPGDLDIRFQLERKSEPKER